MQIVNDKNGDLVETEGRAWWLGTAREDGDRVVVACINGWGKLRKPSEAQLAADPDLNPYWLDASNEGEPAYYGITLTEEDLEQYGIVPGVLTTQNVIVDGQRPTSNTLRHVTSARQHQQSMDWLQNDCIGKPSDY